MLRNPVSTRILGLISTTPVLALAITAIALTPKPVRADDEGAFKGTLTVQYTAGQQCASGDMTCKKCVQNSSFWVEAQGIADTSIGPLFARVLKCFNPSATPQFPYGTYAGTMTLSVTPPVTPPSLIPPPKDILTLAYSGQNDDAGDLYVFGPFGGTLTVKGGAGRFQGASGALTFIATGGPSVAVPAPSPFGSTGVAFYSIQGTIGQGEQR